MSAGAACPQFHVGHLFWTLAMLKSEHNSQLRVRNFFLSPNAARNRALDIAETSNPRRSLLSSHLSDQNSETNAPTDREFYVTNFLATSVRFWHHTFRCGFVITGKSMWTVVPKSIKLWNTTRRLVLVIFFFFRSGWALLTVFGCFGLPFYQWIMCSLRVVSGVIVVNLYTF